IFLFFFSSRRRHTRWPRDWSSDVCSSDLISVLLGPCKIAFNPYFLPGHQQNVFHVFCSYAVSVLPCRSVNPSCQSETSNERQTRSEERRVGKECRSRWSP